MKKLLLSLLILAMSILLAGCPKDDTDSTNIKTKGIRAYFKVLIKKDSVIASADLRVGGNTTLLNLTERESLLCNGVRLFKRNTGLGGFDYAGVVPIADQYNFQFIRTDETIDITLTPPVPSVPTILSVQSSIMFGDDLVIKWEKSTPEQPVNITVSGAVINDTNKYNVSDTGEGIMFLDYKFDITPNTYPLTVTLYRERKYDIPHPFELLNASIRAEDSKNVNCVVPEK